MDGIPDSAWDAIVFPGLPPAFDNATLISNLLSIVSSLLVAIKPPLGARTVYTKPLVEELDLMRLTAPDPVRPHLRHAIHALTSSDVAVPLHTCLSAHAALATALSLLSQYSFPSPPSPAFSRFPDELVEMVVQECQFGDFRDRQNTNLALSLTNRRLRKVVFPILHNEAHFSTPGQLERFWQHAEDTDFYPWQATFMTVSMNVTELQVQPNGRWAGRLIPSMVNDVTRLDLKRFEMHISPRAGEEADEDADDFLSALGVSEEQWMRLFRIYRAERVHVPMYKDVHGLRLLTTEFFEENYATHLQIGDSSIPVKVAPVDVLIASRDLVCLNEDVDVVYDGLDFVALHLPWFNFPVLALETVLTFARTECPRSSPRLSSLEASICLLGDLATRMEDIRSFFPLIAPSIRRLVLRFTSRQSLPAAEVGRLVEAIAAAAGLEQCTLLRHLEIGGESLDGLPSLLARLPLRSLVLLPSPSFTAVDALRLVQRIRTSDSLKSVKLCLPPAGVRHNDWPATQLNSFLSTWQVETRVETYEAENRFWWPEEFE